MNSQCLLEISDNYFLHFKDLLTTPKSYEVLMFGMHILIY